MTNIKNPFSHVMTKAAMSDELKTIRVPVDAYEDAKERKEEMGVTWGEYLTSPRQAENTGVEDAREVDVPSDEDIEEAVERAIDAKLPDIRDVTADEVIDRIEARH